jgi:hypothetical protein
MPKLQKDPLGEVFGGKPIHFGASDAAMSDEGIAEANASDAVVLVVPDLEGVHASPS